MIEQVLVNGFSGRFSDPPAVVVVKTSKEKIEFSCDGWLINIVTTQLKTDNGQTVGERNRAWLHAKLDEWLDGNFEEQNT